MTSPELLDEIRKEILENKQKADIESNAINHAIFRAKEATLIWVESKIEQLEKL